MTTEAHKTKSLKITIGSLSAAMFLNVGLPAQSALPPRYQNVNNLETMTKFIKQHPKVASFLEAVNVRDATIRFGSDCKVIFEYQNTGLLGSYPLVFKSSNCPID